MLLPVTESRRVLRVTALVIAGLVSSASGLAQTAAQGVFPDAAGSWGNFGVGGVAATNGAFFQSLGSNGRSCGSCHVPSDAWTATPAKLLARFQATKGTDPVFASIDGSNCPTLDVSTLAARQTASSLLLKKGLIRIPLSPPATADYTVSALSNPYGCTSKTSVSVYRRIPPSANLQFLSTVMWDGRETRAAASLVANLSQQASDAVTGHAQAVAVPSALAVQSIVGAELAQFMAQVSSSTAGSLIPPAAQGGPVVLAQQDFFAGINDPFGARNTGNGVPPLPVFTLYTPWETLVPRTAAQTAQASIGRGQRLFNTLPIAITRVKGLNDLTDANGVPRTTIIGTCGTCHNTPNVGSHSMPLLVDLGIGASNRATPDMPLITLTNKKTGTFLQVTDPGLALVSGKFADIGKFKVPGLRGLAARAPYFHDGSAASLTDVVRFYNGRFNLNLTAQQEADLTGFLQSL